MMKLPVLTFSLASFFLLIALSSFAQNTYNINLTDEKRREEINFIGTETNVHVCGLEVGQTYQVWAVKQNCHPTVKLAGSGQFNNTQTFVATADCMDFVLRKDMSSPTCAAGTVWFSIGCSTCSKKTDPFGKISCTPNGSGQYLIEDVFIGGGCFDINNVVTIGSPEGRGTFSDGGSTVNMNDGIVLTSGNVGIANGPNNSNSAGANVGGPTSDPDLDILTGGSLFDVQGIEFDFRPTVGSINFQYAFGSEEYCEFVNSGFNDVFGFFISGPGISGGFSSDGQNIAVLPGSGIFVSINNVNHLTNTGYFVPNQGNCGGMSNPDDIQYDGYTQLLVATANVIPCETYRIRLVIADVGDGIYDSGVFLGAGTFSAGGTATAEALSATTGSNVVYETCNDGTIVFTRAGGSNALPLTLNFTVLPSSTATPGVDYTPFPLTFTIPPGLDSYAMPINVIADNIPEGIETIILSLTNSCSCSSLEIILEIHDPPVVQLDLPDIEGCAGSPIFLEAMPTGGIPNSTFTFVWDNGQTGPILQAAPTQNTTYSVTTTDACGGTASATSNVQVAEVPTAMMDSPGGVLCTSNPSASIDLVIEFTGTPNWILNYTINGQPQPSILVTATPYTLTTNVPGIYLLTDVISAIGDCVGPATGVAIIDMVTIDNSVFTTPYTCSDNGSMTVFPAGGTDPYDYAWSNGFPNFPTAIGLLPGIYTVTVSDANGCTASASGAITSPPPLLSSAVGSQVNCTNPEGGTITLTVGGGTAPYSFLWSNGTTDQNASGLGIGLYTVTVTDLDGCTSTAAASVTSNVQLPLAVAQSNNPINCNNQVVTVTGQGSQTGPNISYNWSGPGVSGPTNQIDVNVQMDGLYTLIVTNNSNGCTNEASVLVSSDLVAPIAVAIGDTLSCNETVANISGNGSSTGPNFQYQWMGSNILSGANALNAVVGEAGTYTLTVTNTTNGCTSSISVEVENDADVPVANIAPPFPITCATNAVTLDGSASTNGPIYTYQWYQNSAPIPGANGLSTTASSTGTYQIIVRNELNGCTASFTTTVTNDLAAPAASASANGQITCTVNSVALNSSVQGNPANFTFEWSTSNGTFVGGTNGQNATAGTPGLYQVVVTNTSNGCTGTATVQVTQDASIPVVAVTSSGNIDCVDTQVQLNGSGSSQSPTITYTWTSPTGNFYSGQNTLTPVVDAAGTYTLTLFDASNQCENQSTVTVTVDNLPPVINMPASPMLDCAVTQTTLDAAISNAPTGVVLNYNWTTVGGQFSGPTNVLTPNVVAPGTYILTATNPDNGCTSTSSIVVDENVTPPVIVIANPDILTCNSNTVPLNATGTSTGIVFQYDWSSPTGSFVTSNSILNPVVNAAGTYTLLVTNTLNNCTTTQQVIVTENVNLPTAIAGTPMTLNCNVTQLNLNGSGSSTGQEFQYLWTGPGVVGNETSLSPMVNEPGTYQLLVTNTANNCQSTASVTIGQDIAAPMAEAGQGGVLSCSMTSMSLDGTGSSTGNNFQYIWSTPNGSIGNGANTLAPSINAPGNYILLVTNTTNGCTNTDLVVIDQDDSLPDAVTALAPPLTCNVTQLTLNGSGSEVGPEFTYLWSTANGSISSGQTTLNPVITAPGVYLLTVTNTATNCTNLASVTVASQTTPPASEAGPSAQLTCTETSLALNGNGSATGSNYSYQWTTTNGNILGGASTLNPMVDEPGTYVLQVTNTTTGCTNTDQVVISESLNTPISVAATPGVLNCNASNLTLIGAGSSTGSTFGYNWSTANGNILNGGTTLSPVINAPGTYILMVTNATNGCTSTASVTVNQDIAAPTAEAGSANLLSCTANTVTLNGNGSSPGAGFTYLWTTSNGNIVSGATTLTPTVNQVGTYVLTVTNNANGCTSSDNLMVGQDNSLPQATIVPPATLTCDVTELTLSASASQGANFSYLWTTVGGNIVAGETTLSPQINQPGLYVLTVTNSTNGCTITTQSNVSENIAQPVANAGQPFVMDCFEELNSLNGTGSSGTGTLAFLWSTSNGALVSGMNTANAYISAPGTYLLTVTNLANGCTDTDQVEITKEGPFTVPEATQPPCFGDKGAIALSGTTGGETPYLYSIDNGANFGNSAIFTNLEPGLYQAVVQDANGCQFEDAVLIEQPNLFDIFVEPQVTVSLGDTYQLNTLVNVPVSEIGVVEWFPGFNLSCTDCLDPVASPTTSTTYTVTVVTKNGCKDSAPVFFRVDKSGGVYVPSAFSPNGDGTNDVFMIFSDTKSVKKVNSFLVFNRWGESVYQYFNFSPNDPAYGWDGKHRGQPLDPAVFVWFAEIEFIDGRVEIFKGDITLIN